MVCGAWCWAYNVEERRGEGEERADRREEERGAEGVAPHHCDEWRVAQRRRLVECHLWQGRFRERSGKG